LRKPDNESPASRAEAQRFDSLLDGLDLPTDWTISDLTASLERRWGCGIVWQALPPAAEPDLCGLHLTRQHHRVVFHRQPTDRSPLRHVIAHAAAHLLLGHDHNSTVTPQLAAMLLTGATVDDELARSAGRSSPSDSDSDRDEREADRLADLMMTRTSAG
jgi:hypothetical protein